MSDTTHFSDEEEAFLPSGDDAVEPEEEEDGDIEETNKALIGCTCDCDPTDHNEDCCQECEDCTGHWE